jgi:hypothetical protein
MSYQVFSSTNRYRGRRRPERGSAPTSPHSTLRSPDSSTHAPSSLHALNRSAAGALRSPLRQLFLPQTSGSSRPRHERRLLQLRRNAGRSRGPQSRFTSRRFLPRSNLKSECARRRRELRRMLCPVDRSSSRSGEELGSERPNSSNAHANVKRESRCTVPVLASQSAAGRGIANSNHEDRT